MTRRATDRQLAFLRTLAHRTGTTFTPPRSRTEASRQIAILLGRGRSSRIELALDRAAIRGGEIDDVD
jgi:hypothetical protein